MRILASLLLLAVPFVAQAKSPLRFEVSWANPMDGRVVLVISTTGTPEPRFSISEGLNSQQMFGADAEGARNVSIDGATLGYPRRSLDEVPAGEYYVQAVLNVYETFHRADGHTVKLPMDQGEGQHWARKPGNLYSQPVKVKIDPAAADVVKIELTKTVPPIEAQADTKYVKHVRIESKLLSAFWGRPMYLGAIVLLPEGFDEHPNTHYPVLYYQGHFSASFNAGVGFTTEPPAAGGGGGRGGSQNSYRFYQDWTSGRLPRMLIVDTQDANPYYDDSYAVYREAIPRHRGTVGALTVRRLDGRMAGAWPTGFLPGLLQRRVGGLSRSDRLQRLFAGQSLPGSECVLLRGPVDAGADSHGAHRGWQGALGDGRRHPL